MEFDENGKETNQDGISESGQDINEEDEDIEGIVGLDMHLDEDD